MTSAGPNTRTPIIVAESSDRRFPVFAPDVLDELAEFGEPRDLEAGEVLYRAGDSKRDFYVLLEGGIEIFQDDESQQLVVAYEEAGQFIGELGLLTGQRTFLAARATRRGRALAIPQDSFRRLMATKPTISDVIFGALIGRRETLRTTSVAETIQIIGSRFSREAVG